MKRSSRHGWTLMQLVDGALRLVATGDRDDLQARRDAMVRGGSIGAYPYVGAGVALYDANGSLRDSFPHAPRLAGGGRMRWPAVLPADGTAAVRWVPPPMDPEAKRLMDSLLPAKRGAA